MEVTPTYVPPFQQVLEALGGVKQSDGEETVTIPFKLLRYLLSCSVQMSSMDDELYLRRNPDVSVAVRNGQAKTVKLHYAEHGYFEDRAGALPAVDEAWYLKVNRDVNAAVKAGHWQSGQQHWEAVGRNELRGPTAAVQASWDLWRALLRTGIDPEHLQRP